MEGLPCHGSTPRNLRAPPGGRGQQRAITSGDQERMQGDSLPLSVAERLTEGHYSVSAPSRIGTMLSYTLKEVASWIASNYGLVMVRRCARPSSWARSPTWRRPVKS